MRNRYILLVDLLLIALAAWGAFTARFDLAFYEHQQEFLPYLAGALLLKPPVFLAVGMYRRFWRFTGIHDLGIVLTAVSLSSVLMWLFVVAALTNVWLMEQFSRVVIFNDWLLTLAATGGIRIAVRVLSDSARMRRTQTSGSVNRVLIAGAGNAGALVVREMHRNPHLDMQPIGFLDDDPAKIGKRLVGLPVFGALKSLAQHVRGHAIDTVIIAMPTAPGPVVRAVVDQCRAAGVKSQIMPGVFELLSGRVGINRLREVEITDLLRRAPVDSGSTLVDYLKGKVVLVTGAGGSIGSELARQIASAGPARLALLGHGENSVFDIEAELRRDFPALRVACIIADVRDDTRLRIVFDRVQPAVVFHAAAHKHVPLMEENPEEAITNNVIGTRNVVGQALRAGAERFVLISTDKAVSPTSIMGASKRMAETIVRHAARTSGRAFVAVRFGNVLGSRGSVVHTFKRQIAEGGPVTVTHPEMTRFFMTIPEAVHLVLEASGRGAGGELFVLDMGEPVKIVDLARDLITLSGLTTDDIPINFTGLRPGEKLHEVLFDDGMQTRRTAHPDILEVSGDDPMTGIELDAVIDRLDQAAAAGDRVTIDDLLASAIPGFRPSARPWDVPTTGR